MNFKRVSVITVVLSLVFCLILCPLSARAAQISDFTYEITSQGLNITGYNGSKTNVEIDEKYTVNGTVYNVYSIGVEAFSDKGITQITLPEGLKLICESAFYNCDSLTSVIIPESVTKVEDYAFDDCNSLTDIKVLNPQLTIGSDAFGYYYEGRKYYLVEGLVLRGFEDSTIEKYAIDNGINFEIYVKPVLGDVTCDGKLDVVDFVRLKKIIAGIVSAEGSKADVNGDGEYTAEDLVTIKTLLLTGEENLRKHTVTFKDWNGTVLSTQKVMHSFAAIAPEAPEREGFKFVGWSTDFKNITRTTVVTAIYEADNTPTFVVNSVSVNAGDRNVTVAVSVKNNPGILGMTLSVEYDETIMTLVDAQSGSALSDVLNFTKANTLASGCNFVWDGQEITAENIKNGEILLLTFNILEDALSGSYPITVSYAEGDIIDGNLNVASFEIENGNITVS